MTLTLPFSIPRTQLSDAAKAQARAQIEELNASRGLTKDGTKKRKKTVARIRNIRNSHVSGKFDFSTDYTPVSRLEEEAKRRRLEDAARDVRRK